ncbi:MULTISPECIES: rhodanese-like domain-containing protein [Tatumella]|uniref:Rhodanese-like domain-containing protein n=2 Tax=Tatumella TaxID=82986 RepID=A0ABW1VTE6_9GAMM|nr:MULTISPECIES: rhodanese-like domain-containing protein [unclassified Tatumella]MBS0857303.1 rhodanese-like domain-containing protein [Tatumella sp. JGM16]MBS0895616.1 rhodanese-like domain-containing protein [Tatumella sp. JGM130]MBS0914056.1 rhodanese-like domain-containing protein [Tatumella sp. JGM91]
MSAIEQLSFYQQKLAYETDSWDLYLALKENTNVVVVDGRSKDAYQREHIPGAINQPHKEICFNNTEHLDKTKIYICYCDGIGCNASTKTAMKLMTPGFQVKELLGGLDWWKRDGYSTDGTEGKEGTPVSCGC